MKDLIIMMFEPG